VRFAGCCNPLPGDAIVGYVSRGRGYIIHTADCPNVQNMEPERTLTVHWEGEMGKLFQAKLRILCRNQKGVLAQIGSVLADTDVNISSGHFHSTVDGATEMVFTVDVKDADSLYLALEQLNALGPVIEAGRLTAPAS